MNRTRCVVQEVQTFMEMSASVEDYESAQKCNKHAVIVIFVPNDRLPNDFSPVFDELRKST